jgi:hypothetical protein
MRDLQWKSFRFSACSVSELDRPAKAVHIRPVSFTSGQHDSDFAGGIRKNLSKNCAP